jgi:hypothetical protein
MDAMELKIAFDDMSQRQAAHRDFELLSVASPPTAHLRLAAAGFPSDADVPQ